ncbi:MAG: DUF1684 domain-containing protein [Cyclobacteriaceae bacterium]
MKIFLTSLFVLFLSLNLSAQDADFVQQIEKHREDLHAEFLDPEETPLDKKGLKKFKGLEYFPIDENYRVRVKYKEHAAKKFFTMVTTTDRRPEYVRFAELTFQLEGKTYNLQAYQNQDLLEDPEYSDYLFVPFNDDTNAIETYGGGRYLDFRIPESGVAYLDFNKAYNPYCCYSDRYSCPIPPQENYIQVRVLAGVKDYDSKH